MPGAGQVVYGDRGRAYHAGDGRYGSGHGLVVIMEVPTTLPDHLLGLGRARTVATRPPHGIGGHITVHGCYSVASLPADGNQLHRRPLVRGRYGRLDRTPVWGRGPARWASLRVFVFPPAAGSAGCACGVRSGRKL
jgi:hypothetical protein